MAEQRYIATVDVQTDRDDLGVQKIAFTKNPAIVIKGVAFAAEVPQMKADAPKMRICAPVLVPGEIYRKSEGGHYLIFVPEEIEGIQQDFMRRLNNEIELFKKEHADRGTSPAYILETWIVEDAEADKANAVYGLGVPVGSWVVIVQVLDKAYYDGLVKDGATGLSIEGFLGHKLELSIENQMKSKIYKKDDTVKLSKVESVHKWQFEVDNTVFKEGEVVTTTNEKGETNAIGSGEYVLEDGRTIITDASGVIQKIKTEEMAKEGQEVPVTMPDGDYISGDGKKFSIVGGVVKMSDEPESVQMASEELEDGSVMQVEGVLAVGAKTSAADGTYKTKSGKTVTVKEGVVTEVDEKQPEAMADDPATPAATTTDPAPAADPAQTYSREEVDKMISDLREEFAAKIADMQIRMETAPETPAGSAVEMSAEERSISALGAYRQATAK